MTKSTDRKKGKDRVAKAEAVELTEKQLGEVAGGSINFQSIKFTTIQYDDKDR
jgi:hypothetical protein